MGYYLQAFICKEIDADLIIGKYRNTIKVKLEQGMALVPMTEELFDEINNFSDSPSIGEFTYLTEEIEQEIVKLIGEKKYSYVEADYFGGEGGQMAIIWNNGKRVQLLPLGQDNINQVLKDFGVIANKGQDEFQTLNLGSHRDTKDWIERL